MAYMRDSAGRRLDSFEVRGADDPAAANTAVLTHRLRAAQEDATLLVLGDSTGAGITRWVYLLAQRLAALFPAYTVLYRAWNDTGQTYDAAVTLQTGTAGRTLTIYNGSVSGSISTYPQTRWATMAPVAPQLVLVNFGHNNVGSTTYRAAHYGLTRQVQERWPSAGLVSIGQNPRAPTDNGSGFAADRANDLVRQRQVMELCASEGYGFINVTQRFLDDPAYATTLLHPDGLHPSDAGGSPAWADEVFRHFRRSTRVVPAAPKLRDSRLWIPASQFLAESGTPSLGMVNTAPAWGLDSTTQEGVAAAFMPPVTWGTADMYVVWSHATATGMTSANNQVRFELGRQNLGPPGVTPLDGLTGQAGGVSVTPMLGFAHNNAAAYPTEYTLIISDMVATTRPMALRIRRLAADATDNLGEDANVLGVLAVRAS